MPIRERIVPVELSPDEEEILKRLADPNYEDPSFPADKAPGRIIIRERLTKGSNVSRFYFSHGRRCCDYGKEVLRMAKLDLLDEYEWEQFEGYRVREFHINNKGLQQAKIRGYTIA